MNQILDYSDSENEVCEIARINKRMENENLEQASNLACEIARSLGRFATESRIQWKALARFSPELVRVLGNDNFYEHLESNMLKLLDKSAELSEKLKIVRVLPVADPRLGEELRPENRPEHSAEQMLEFFLEEVKAGFAGIADKIPQIELEGVAELQRKAAHESFKSFEEFDEFARTRTPVGMTRLSENLAAKFAFVATFIEDNAAPRPVDTAPARPEPSSATSMNALNTGFMENKLLSGQTLSTSIISLCDKNAEDALKARKDEKEAEEDRGKKEEEKKGGNGIAKETEEEESEEEEEKKGKASAEKKAGEGPV